MERFGSVVGALAFLDSLYSEASSASAASCTRPFRQAQHQRYQLPLLFPGRVPFPLEFVPFICCKLVYRQIHSRYQGYAGVGYYGSVDVICSLLPSTVLRLVTTMLYHGKSHQIAMTYVNTVWYLI